MLLGIFAERQFWLRVKFYERVIFRVKRFRNALKRDEKQTV